MTSEKMNIFILGYQEMCPCTLFHYEVTKGFNNTKRIMERFADRFNIDEDFYRRNFVLSLDGKRIPIDENYKVDDFSIIELKHEEWPGNNYFLN